MPRSEYPRGHRRRQRRLPAQLDTRNQPGRGCRCQYHPHFTLPATSSGAADDLVERTVRAAIDSNILVVAPAGNNRGECWCIPAALPGVLAVGAMNDDGKPFQFSNWGGIYERQGIIAPGERILGAALGGGTSLRKGTSCAAPVVTGVAALLMSLQDLEGNPIDAGKVRDAILESAEPCDPADLEDPGRCLKGKINVRDATELLFPSVREVVAGSVKPSAARDAVTPSQNKAPVFALGIIGFDFGTEARRDTFKQQMPPVPGPGGTLIPANPFDARQLVAYLTENPSEAKSLIWTLNLELTPIYAIEPYGPYGEVVYESLIELLDAQSKAPSDRDYVTRASIPGLFTGDTVKLFSGQIVPALAVDAKRGIHGWAVNQLIEAALRAVESRPSPATAELISAVTNFLNRMYYDYRNLGLTSAERALNFAITNIFQTLVSFAATLARGKQVGAIQVLKSPHCRIDSDCWDVQIKFFDPHNVLTAWTVIRYAVDVSDKLPVTLGNVVEWEAAVFSV